MLFNGCAIFSHVLFSWSQVQTAAVTSSSGRRLSFLVINQTILHILIIGYGAGPNSFVGFMNNRFGSSNRDSESSPWSGSRLGFTWRSLKRCWGWTTNLLRRAWPSLGLVHPNQRGSGKLYIELGALSVMSSTHTHVHLDGAHWFLWSDSELRTQTKERIGRLWSNLAFI